MDVFSYTSIWITAVALDTIYIRQTFLNPPLYWENFCVLEEALCVMQMSPIKQKNNDGYDDIDGDNMSNTNNCSKSIMIE
jgi:hypothetical protein